MPTTTTTAGPTESQLRRGGAVTSPSLVREKSEGPRMVRLTVNLPSQLVEQMRDAVYWTPGLTLAWMVARALRASLADLETIHQGPFPRRLKPLRAGRPRLIGQSMNVRPLGTGEGDGPGKGVVERSCGHEKLTDSLDGVLPQRALGGEENACLKTPRMPK